MSDLNQGQETAGEAFFGFLFQPGNGFIISGPAGVGKTYLMSHIIDIIMPRYQEACKLMGIEPEYDSIVMCATTNKAAENLALATKRPTQTIHSFMNLRVKDNFSDGTQKLEKTVNWTIHQRMIIFVDECSMIDTPLFQLLQEGTHNCKIVYVGDHNQLQPVKESLSPVYKQDYPMYELTEPMRNRGQVALMDLCAQLRSTVETGLFAPIKVVPGVIDLLDDDQMEAEIASVFANQTMDSRILAYTNQKVIQYNDHIRTIRNLPDQFTEGEYLINNSSITINRKRISVEEEITIRKIHGRERVDITKDASMEVIIADLYSTVNGYFNSVKLPVDREYYTNMKKYYARNKNWDRYGYLVNNFPDLRQRDASTVHKSQGSTYETVFVDLNNISTCHIENQAARMLYVAFSRARSRIVLYGELAQKYGGLIT